MALVTPYKESIQYDGTNGSFIIGTWVTGATDFVSDNGTTLTWENEEDAIRTVNVGGWVVKSSDTDGDPEQLTNAQYLASYVEIDPPTLTLSMGYALTPNITASGSANVAVDLDTTMSGTSYEATAVLTGTSALLTDLDITAVAITDNNTVTVTVQNNGIIALAGATVVVAAAELT